MYNGKVPKFSDFCRNGCLLDSICAEDREKPSDGWTMETLPYILCWYEPSQIQAKMPMFQCQYHVCCCTPFCLLSPDINLCAGFWTLQHFLRPFRLTIALGMAPAFDRILTFIQNRTGWNKRNAFGLYLACFGTLTSLFVFGSIYLFAGPMAFARHA